MDYVYTFVVVAVILLASGILLHFFQRNSNRVSQHKKPNGKTIRVGSEANIKKADEIPSVSRELTALKQELMTIVLHNQRTYQSNIEIARRDFSKRSIANPSETALIKRAIEIWRDDNR